MKSKMATDSSKLIYTTNKWGEEIAKRQSAELDGKTFKDLYDKDLSYIKSHLGVNKNDVQGIIKAAFQAHYEGGSDSIRVDTITNTVSHTTETAYISSDSNKWISIYVNISPLRFKYRVITFDSIIFVPHLVSTGFLRPKQLFVSGENLNPNSRITGLSYVRVNNYHPKHFVVSAGIGTTYPFTPLVYIGVGYKLFEF